MSFGRLLTWRGALQGLLLLLAVGGLVSLGCWQLRRGHEKAALIDNYQKALQGAPLALIRSSATAVPERWLPVVVHGQFLGSHQLLLDNQSQGEVAGFDVWAPLRTDDGALLMIDRGWLPHDRRDQVPGVPTGAQELRGLWRSLPVPGLRLQADNCSDQGWPRVVEYPTAADLRCLYSEAPLPGVVLQTGAAADGLVREWHPSPGFPPERHYAYAAQWFGLALALLILSLRLLLKTPQ